MFEKIIYKKIGDQQIGFYESEWKCLDKDKEETKKCMEYCKNVLLPYMNRKTINFKHSSYGLKHIVEREIDMYVSNGTLKYCLAMLGVKGYQEWGNPNICYPISQKFYKNR